MRKYLKILRIPPEFSAVQCISFFRFGRVSYYAFHTYHTNIGNILLSIEDILYMLPRIAKISHIGGKVVPELGENGLSSVGPDPLERQLGRALLGVALPRAYAGLGPALPGVGRVTSARPTRRSG